MAEGPGRPGSFFVPTGVVVLLENLGAAVVLEEDGGHWKVTGVAYDGTTPSLDVYLPKSTYTDEQAIAFSQRVLTSLSRR